MQMIQQQEYHPKFEWFQCPLILEQQKNEDDPPDSQPEYMSLKSQLTFYDLNNKQCPFELTPQLQQDPLYDGEIGFNWHKSWLIPNIKLKSQLKNMNVNQQYTLKYYITSCYPVKEYDNNFLRQVKLQGQAQKAYSAQEHHASFNNLKFKTTSFKINGARLSLLIIVSIEASGMIISSKISSPIYIDSRKQARLKKAHNTQKIQNTKFNQQLFIYVNQEKIKIQNNMDDFIAYYSAPNIRFKFKHPFYVCFKFNKCFKLYYNSQMIDTKCQNSDYILDKVWEAIQKQQPNKIMIQCEYINFQSKKRVLSIFNNWRITFIHFVFNKQQILDNYVMLDYKLFPNAFKVCSNQKSIKTKQKQVKGAPVQLENYYRTQMVLNKGPKFNLFK